MKKMILATKTEKLPEFLKKHDTFHAMEEFEIFKMFDEAGYWCGPREDLEIDPTYKQIIPYIVIKVDDKYLSYVRTSKGDEDRLHDKVSIGVGGHIDFTDVNRYQESVDIISTLEGTAIREVIEEIGFFDTIAYESRYNWIGIVNDDSNDVGKVHIGVVCIVDLKADEIPSKSKDESISKLTLMSLEELQATELNLETWSRHVVDYLKLVEYTEKEENYEFLD